jgi:hypothetical protein
MLQGKFDQIWECFLYFWKYFCIIRGLLCNVKLMIFSRYRPITVPLPFSSHRESL